jgi:hypothetical protein
MTWMMGKRSGFRAERQQHGDFLRGCARHHHREPHRHAIGINHRMNLVGQAAARPAHQLFLVAGD